MSKTILVGCKLPSGITLEGTSGQVELNGMNSSLVAGGGFGLTRVPETEWMYLSAIYAEHSAFKSQSIFTYKDSDKVADVAAVAEDLADVKTGFEGLDPTAPTHGIKPEDETKLRQELSKNQNAAAPRKTNLKAADKAAALELAQGQ